MAAKRILFEVHRWVGIATALFMAMWFITGLTIVYSGSTNQTRAQQLAQAEALLPHAGWLSLEEAWALSSAQRTSEKRSARGERGEQDGAAHGQRQHEGGREGHDGQSRNRPDSVYEARLVRRAGEPLWLVDDARGQRFAISALDGKLFEVTIDRALLIARNSVHGAQVTYLDTVDTTLSLRNQQTNGPFYRFTLDSEPGTQLVVSARTGEVLQQTTRIGRGMYVLGNWLHVFRPLDYIGLGEQRHTVIAWVSFFAVITIMAGLIIGWLRWRPGFFGKPTYSEGRTQPYRAFWFRWHFWAGLVGGTFTLLWAVSGYLNNNPWDIFSPVNASRAEITRYQGGELPAVARAWKPTALTAESENAVELGWRRLGDSAVLLAYKDDGQRIPQKVAGTVAQFDEVTLQAAVQRLFGDMPIANRVLQQEYDSYYYPSRRQSVIEKPLPVWRVELQDKAATRLYIDPQDGRLVLKQDQSRRVFRWAFSALHHWDFGWIVQRPLWDVWMVSWILFGVVLSISSVVLGWKRLRHTFRSKKRQGSKTGQLEQLETETQAA